MQKNTFIFIALFASILLGSCTETQKQETESNREIWTKEQANAWYEDQEWLVGPNFTPSNAINQLEMWQEETYDSVTIDRELGWAADLGMNTVRVYLHDALYEQDSLGFLHRIDHFLGLADKHNIKTLLVIFDSCWDPFFELGKQREPTPFTHNSGWVQSPGQLALKDSTQYPRLERYVKGVIKRFANDQRVLGWDIWNEPDNMTGPSYEKVETPDKVALVLPLLRKSFAWARSVNPSQPITSGVWSGDWSSEEKMKPIERLQVEESDIITFHNYDGPEDFEERIQWLQRYEKPIICTEYMARPNGSTFATFLPIAKKYNVGMINWGFVDGKTQTKFPWDSWTKTYTDEPPVWFHDILRGDGSPYDPAETEVIKSLTGAK
ncbi:cellulase family glycosylhydrolase [Sphingobacterium sp. SGR-19]|uniref:cellulase family glycosylhydrolase n=1 Tax=Sphingobacterium sp. SGR-19 TaxID=2710886 RepID=UPI0013E9C71D|nr:cellulase family glycosylhydrolase [Sphingobacterium sp. SGR-19]NGM67232.1 glycoside hydrolase family 5 protein [Sphingobacterium sp. SGR-19]